MRLFAPKSTRFFSKNMFVAAFFAISGIAAVVLVFGCKNQQKLPPYDVILAGGIVIDGTGAPARVADVALRGDKIAFIGDLTGQNTRQCLDVKGRVVAPGFIDLRNLSARALQTDHSATSQIAQGITTVLLNADGGPSADFWPIGAFLFQFEQNPAAVNVATMLSHATIRRFAMQKKGIVRSTDAEDLAFMAVQIDRGMRDGAFGIASSLSAGSAKYAAPDEMKSLATKVLSKGGLFIVSPRNPIQNLVGSLLEIENFAHGLAQPLHVGALTAPGLASADFSRLQNSLLASTNTIFQVTPFSSWYGEIIDVVPERAYFNLTEIRKSMTAIGGPERLQIVAYSAHPEQAGKNLAEIASLQQRQPEQAFIEIVKNGGATVKISPVHPEQFFAFLQRNHVVVVSDAGMGIAQPASHTAFPQFIAETTREKPIFTLPQAIYKITGLPASLLGLPDRGKIAEDYCADLTVFNPETIGAKAGDNILSPRPEGITLVMVNGRIVFADNRTTGERPGRVLRHKTAAESTTEEPRVE